jgi:CDP-glycerol glycerophosphotransferase
MKQFIINKIKHSKALYSLYFSVGSTLLKFYKCFIKPDEDLFLFVSFGGKKFDDSPRAIYERMMCDERFKNKKFIWAFLHPENINLPQERKVKIDTLEFYRCALKARVWITNSSVERGLSFKGKRTFVFNTWHGSAIKKLGSDLSVTNDGFKSKGKSKTDIMAAQGDFDVEVFSRAFSLPQDVFRITGLPRNDVLSKYDKKHLSEIRESLHFNDNKKVILYAPTYREYEFDNNGAFLKTPVDIKKWERLLGDKYILLFRAHHAVSKYMKIVDNDFIRDVSKYPKLEDLMIASDILISDYSSILFDYSIMDKPMICFCYDFDKYEQERGMYFDIRDYLDHVENEDDLLSLLLSIDTDKSVDKTIKFRNRFVTEYGEATSKTLDIISKELNI